MNNVFQVGKTLPPEQWVRRGKPEWANAVRLEMSLDRALELAQLIIGDARYQRDGGEPFMVTLFGELSEETEALPDQPHDSSKPNR